MDTRQDLKKAKRLVVKVGSSVICEKDAVSQGRLRALAGQFGQLNRRGYETIIVSSGAVAAGFRKLGLHCRPTTLKLKQVCAAAGQVSLMIAWEKALGAFDLKCAQILLTADDFSDRSRFLNARNTFISLVEMGVVPIVNENDTVAVEELKVGDNDTLGSMVANLTEADLFINLTDLDGLYDSDPRKNKSAKLFLEVPKVDKNVLNLAGTDGGPLGTGGMFTKVRAAGRLADRGLASLIANGHTRDVLIRIMAGEELGTFFKPSKKTRKARKHWLAFAARPKGSIIVDQGAALALVERGKSLLPGGIVDIVGLFDVGDPVSIADRTGTNIGVGLTNYSSPEIKLIKGHTSKYIEKTLGYSHSEEVIHRDNLVIF
ncbi:MAG: glutamate 5-kinase [Deltaproteobacteria bacterium]|jgi:glutamate 5-kinase|nr:glutamate 5-kinase [Deltaproteobacteria bacterium]